MPQLHSGLIGGSKYQITNSVRLRASASASFSRTPGAAGNMKLLTKRFRIKRGTLGVKQVIASAGTASIDAFYFDSSDRLCLDVLGTVRLVTTSVYRDPSGWYPDVGFTLDVANGTAALRAAILINGTEVPSYSTDTRSAIANSNTNWNNTVVQYLGKDNAGSYFDGYFAEVLQVDGSTSVTAYSATDANGVRVPVAPSATYGTTGSLLDFKDANLTAGSNVGLGKDVSGNGNYWTTNNISVTAGVTYDAMVDTPTNNYATLNPIIASAANISYAALRSGTTAVQGTMEAAIFAGAYWEVTAAGSAVTAGTISGTGTTNTTTVTANKVFGFRLTGAGALDFINITDVGSWTSITTGLTAQQFPYGITQAADWNFGQRPFIGTPSGKALCTANLPAVAIANPAKHFDAKTRTGTGAAFNVTGEGFAPDFLWSKSRSAATDHILSDRIRGTTKYLVSDSTAAEATDAQAVTAFNSDGFSGGTMAALNTNAATYIDWLWKANGAGVSNTDGSITSTVSANQTAGFSIVTFDLNNTQNPGTVGHGLGKTPGMFIFKNRDLSDNWYVWHKNLSGATDSYLNLNGTGSAGTGAGLWGSGATSALCGFRGASLTSSASNQKCLAMFFAEIPGYSKFGSYVGNGAADGTNVICGFSPRYVLIKSSTAVDDWRIYDSMRPGYNVIGGTLLADTAGAETTSAEIDFTANGFKLRVATTPNAAQTYIYAAFAAYPFGGSNVSPSPAR